MNLDLLLEDLNVDAMNADVKDAVEDVIAIVEDVIVEETRMISLEETFSQVKKEKERDKEKEKDKEKDKEK